MTSGLYAISPLDGRYAEKTAPLRAYFSEWALIKYRLRVEVAWLLALADNPAITHIQPFTPHERGELDGIVADFDEAAATRVKAIEAETRHDVKAVEYYLRERLPGANLGRASSSIHFACTSADINNLAYALMLRDAMRQVWQPEARALQRQIGQLARATAGSPMLARTHGQAATPTTLGKELAVFVGRLRRQLESIESQSYLGKFNGAVGAYNAHHVAYPDLDWLAFTRGFVESLGLTFNPLSTQIEAHDWLAELAHGLMRYNTILLDFCRDCWTYIALGYFRQQQRANEVGSSTMPHKVNPIDFENAEANLGLSSATLSHLASKLPRLTAAARPQRFVCHAQLRRGAGAQLSGAAFNSARLEQGRC